MTEFDFVLTDDARILEISPHNRGGTGTVAITQGTNRYTFDLVAARRLARVLLQAAEVAEVDPEPGQHYAGTVEFGGKVAHLTIDDAVRLAKVALEGGAEL